LKYDKIGLRYLRLFETPPRQ